jgi:hypothetical protein
MVTIYPRACCDRKINDENTTGMVPLIQYDTFFVFRFG